MNSNQSGNGEFFFAFGFGVVFGFLNGPLLSFSPPPFFGPELCISICAARWAAGRTLRVSHANGKKNGQVAMKVCQATRTSFWLVVRILIIVDVMVPVSHRIN